MALAYAGTIDLNIASLLKGHVYLVLGGYISITIMGLSVVLIPMFTLSHGFSMKPLEIAMYMMSGGVILVVISSLMEIPFLEYIGYLLSASSMIVYFSLIYVIYSTRPRKENDVYAISLMFSYTSMLVAIALGVLYFVVGNKVLLLASGWLLFYGFFAFLITGHIYKIIPFLVWFERFSPLVGKQKVPMLADMVPYKSSQAQFIFSALGVIIVTIAILFQSDMLIGAGASFLVVGAIAFVRSVFYMINFE